jgi:hypothetical protein
MILPQTSCVYVGIFSDDTCVYTTDRKEGYVLSAIEMWCEDLNIKINHDMTGHINI